jgi:DNA invertase Pin-like site-specific DNA recombinase
MVSARAIKRRGRPSGETHFNARYTDHEVELVRQLHEQGQGYKAIAKRMEMPVRTVRDWVLYKGRR